MSADRQILNLLYTYAERIDSGDLEGAAGLFGHAEVRLATDITVDAAGLLDIWQSTLMVYPDGTPRTKHVITNAIIDVDEAAGAASCRSYYSVLQQADDIPLQVIAAGRYHDQFERVDGQWRFRYRDYSLLDLVGDVSSHLALGVPTPGDERSQMSTA